MKVAKEALGEKLRVREKAQHGRKDTKFPSSLPL